MKPVISLLLPLVLFLIAAQVAPAADKARPNFVFILADDLGWSDVGCYGSPFNETPNIDRLAREGVRFTQAYTAGSICSPTRASLMTGKFPVRTGVTDYIPGLNPPNTKLLASPTRRELALDETTIAEALKRHGYQTFYGGKWHLGGKGFEPTEQGFDVYAGPELGQYGKDWQVGQRITDQAIRYLERRDRERPFFIYLSYHEPHIPILEYPNHIERFKAKAAKLPPLEHGAAKEHDGMVRLRQDDAAYGSEVAGLDEEVGRVLRKLDELNLAGNTVVVFFSDNGGLSMKDQPGPTSNAPLRAGKGWLYEGGVRVPCVIRAPGVIQSGLVSDVPVISTDFYPTFLELAGARLMPEQHADGVSLVSILRGGAAPDRQTLYWHYPHYHGSTWAPGSAIRDGDWKLIEFIHYDKIELYHLKEDIGERSDLSKQMPEKAAAMLAKLRAWQKETGAAIPVPNPDYKSGAAAAPATAPAKKKKKEGK